MQGQEITWHLLRALAATTNGSNSTTTTTAPPKPTTQAMTSMPGMPDPPSFFVPMQPFIDQFKAAAAAANVTEATMPEFTRTYTEAVIRETRRVRAEFQIMIYVTYGVMFLFSAVLIAHIRHNRHMALKGDADAAQKIILPAFEPLLWVFTALMGVYLIVTGSLHNSDVLSIRMNVVIVEIMYATRFFVSQLVPVFMLQKSLSKAALARATAIAFLLSTYTIPPVFLMYHFGDPADRLGHYWIHHVLRGLLYFPYIYYFIYPPMRATPFALRAYIFYIVVSLTTFLVPDELLRTGMAESATTSGWVNVIFAWTCPLFVWLVLKADTEHWRGIGKRAVELQARFQRRGKVEERISSKGLHVLIEMHRKFIIDFSQLDIQDKIGEGEMATVYAGRIIAKQLPVAIKVYTPAKLTEDTVAVFSHEAALCAALRHPNVVTFHGICVCPPTISLVTERCQGSLKDVTEAAARRFPDHPTRQQQLLNLAFMLDAARAVAYLHSFSPPYVHRDINPWSFQVDHSGFTKLTNFGSSSVLAVRPADAVKRSIQQTVLDVSDNSETARIRKRLQRQRAEYLAPEVIRGNNAGANVHAEAADVYSLAVTMWDVLHPGTPKYVIGLAESHDLQSKLDHEAGIYEQVFAGQRPPIAPSVQAPMRKLLELSWDANPRVRPSALGIVRTLETMQEEACAVFAMELMEEVDCGAVPTLVPTSVGGGRSRSFPTRAKQSFAGNQAIERMLDVERVATEAEGIRLGSMLMDTGLLHHIKHVRCFENSDARFVFDDEAVHNAQPVAILERGVASVSQDPGSRGTHGRSSAERDFETVDHFPARLRRSMTPRPLVSPGGSDPMIDGTRRLQCPCRRLGQRLESAQTTRRRLGLKFKTLNDENLLTATLLNDEPNNNFTMFDDQDQTRPPVPTRKS